MSNELSNVTLALLAGGEGSRMGMPKGNLRVKDRPILEFLLARFAWPGPTLLVTAPGRERPHGYEMFTREVADPVPGEGPLRGVHTALEGAGTDELLVTTVDMPGLGAEHLLWLAGQFRTERQRRPNLAGLMTSRPNASGGQVEPFPAALHRSALAVVAGRLGSGRRSVRALADEATFLTIDAPASWDERCWENLNRPEDLQSFLNFLAGRTPPEDPKDPENRP